jgi:hypothetical protein
LSSAIGVDDGRRIQGAARMRFMNSATQFPGVDFVIAGPGEDPAALAPVAALSAPGISAYSFLAPGEYDLYLRLNQATTSLSGPTRISVAALGIYSVLAVDGPDTATAAVVLLDDFP